MENVGRLMLMTGCGLVATYTLSNGITNLLTENITYAVGAAVPAALMAWGTQHKAPIVVSLGAVCATQAASLYFYELAQKACNCWFFCGSNCTFATDKFHLMVDVSIASTITLVAIPVLKCLLSVIKEECTR
jgi:hypothetical protein